MPALDLQIGTNNEGHKDVFISMTSLTDLLTMLRTRAPEIRSDMSEFQIKIIQESYSALEEALVEVAMPTLLTAYGVPRHSHSLPTPAVEVSTVDAPTDPAPVDVPTGFFL